MAVLNDIKNGSKNRKGFEWAVSRTKLEMIILGFEKRKRDAIAVNAANPASPLFTFNEEDIKKAYIEQGGLILENGKYSNHKGIPPKRKTRAETMGIMPDDSEFDSDTGIFVGPSASAPKDPDEDAGEDEEIEGEHKINRRKK